MITHSHRKEVIRPVKVPSSKQSRDWKGAGGLPLTFGEPTKDKAARLVAVRLHGKPWSWKPRLEAALLFFAFLLLSALLLAFLLRLFLLLLGGGGDHAKNQREAKHKRHELLHL